MAAPSYARPIAEDPVLKERRAVEAARKFDDGITYGVPTAQNGLADLYPETVLIVGNNSYCTGVLVSRRSVVTAGHCFCDGILAKAFIDAAPGTEIDIDSSKSASRLDCKDFNGTAIPPGSVDIAMLHLKKEAPLIPRPIATEEQIRKALDTPEADIAIVGYGRNERGEEAKTKRFAIVPVVSMTCERSAAQNHSPVADAELFNCTKHVEMVTGAPAFGAVGACDGDSGGPSYLDLPSPSSQMALVAITSRLAYPQLGCGYGSIQVLLTGETYKWINRQRQVFEHEP